MKRYKRNNSSDDSITIMWKYNYVINATWFSQSDLYCISALLCLYFPMHESSRCKYVIKNGSVKIKHERIYHKI